MKKLLKRALCMMLVLIMCAGFCPIVTDAAVTSYANEEKIYHFLTDEIGFNTAAACGIMVNMYYESKFNPKCVNKAGPYYGLLQMGGSRWTSVKTWCKKNGYDPMSLEGQLNHLKYEMSSTNKYYRYMSKVKNTAGGTYDAAYYWCYNYERPANKASVSKMRANVAKSKYWPEYSKLGILEQPKSVSAASGKKATVSVSAKGKGLTYQWYVAEPGSTDFEKSSIKKSTYSVTMNDERDDRKLYCVIKDSAGNSVKTKTVVINKKGTPMITKEPVSTSASAGDHVRVTIKASGSGLKYNWYVAEAGSEEYVKSSITSATYSAKMNSERDDRKVYCIVTDSDGDTVKSNTVVINKKGTPMITKEPVSASAAEGEHVKVTIKAKGTNLTYQWYVAMSDSDDYTESVIKGTTYSTRMDETRNGRKIYCVVSDGEGNEVKSNTVTISMK